MKFRGNVNTVQIFFIRYLILLMDQIFAMFEIRKNIFIDPKVVYDVNASTTNLTLGFGLKF